MRSTGTSEPSTSRSMLMARSESILMSSSTDSDASRIAPVWIAGTVSMVNNWRLNSAEHTTAPSMSRSCVVTTARMTPTLDPKAMAASAMLRRSR